MGLFEKTVAAKPAFGKDYAPLGTYWVLISRVKFDRSFKGSEFMAFETNVIRVIDAPADDKGNPTVKVGQPVNLVFPDHLAGNDTRLKAFLLVAAGEPNKPCQESELTAEAMKQISDPALQPVKGIALEIYTRNQTTRAGRVITAPSAIRQVARAEVLAAADEKTNQSLLAIGIDLNKNLLAN